MMPYKDKKRILGYQKEWRDKNRDKMKENGKIYYEENRELCLLRKKDYYKKNKGKLLLKRKEVINNNPWWSNYYAAKNRCTNKRGKNYDTYGGRGIKFLLTMEEIKELWFRDKAILLKRATIDRIDNDSHYMFSNCRFIEQGENATKGNYESRWK